mmetsp:Transcript_23385/g.34522  ORF Transcript_23385/g.34522 Transcript_23385/m.34522 type:complete len:418 (+) Transcript_23385:40-1293(+)|eukprot:CAMPEP_0194204962 /NCGR_PEP_ID=MMETSP0156-20130528/4345_1 /TAXON_ID=33649 /ORGANISM="Thalassionema nitzschioides, Strain L26-B" /LENGTH=417 /DNA_ID=CAMNT_0038931109 /DNA_START=16 /DNA_END=1269 /DNA_ORIENTATION=-
MVLRKFTKVSTRTDISNEKSAVTWLSFFGTLTVVLLTLFGISSSSVAVVEQQRTFLRVFRSATAQVPQNPSTTKLSKLVHSNTRFCMVHVGKTSGSKVGCEVSTLKTDRFRHDLKCRFLEPTSAGNALERAFAGRVHMNSNFCYPPYEFFLYTLRNPLDRIVSWFHYERDLLKQNNNHCLRRLHQECSFSTVDEFAKATTFNYNTTENDDCSELAWKAATGRRPCSGHNAMNYEHYLQVTYAMEQEYEHYLHIMTQKPEKETKQKPILVIRQEHLAEDWDTLSSAFNNDVIEHDPMLRVPGSVIFNSTAGKVSPLRGGANTFLSPEGRAQLCIALCREIQMYKYLLLQAWNLDERQAKQSIADVISMCPKETYEIRTCPNEELPVNKFDKINDFLGVSKGQMLSSFTDKEQVAVFKN